MDELMIKMAAKFMDRFEKFLRACKAEGDNTIDDVLKRFEDLKKKT